MANVLLLLQALLLLNASLLLHGKKHSHPPPFAKVAHHRSQIRRSFSFPPQAFGERTEDIRLVGNAAVMGDGSVKIPALDSPMNQAGRALFASPVRMWDPKTSVPASFETSFSFFFSPSRNASQESGGGLAFIIAPDEITVGREGPYLGMLNDACVHHRREKRLQHPVIAVEFDTFKDAEFWDPNDNHVGLNLGSLVSDQTADLSRAGVFLKNSSLITAKISYNSSSQHIQVRVSPENHQPGEWDDDLIPPLISSPVDISSFLREYMFVGFSASTGAEALIHTVVSWNFSCESHAVQRYPSSPSSVSASASSEELTGKSHLSRMECEDEIVEDKFDRASSEKGTHPPPAFFVFISVSATFLFIILNVLLFCRRSRIHTHHLMCTGGGGSNEWSSQLVLLPRPRPLHKPREFDMKELLIAAGEFNEKQKLGEGPSGAVYRGSLQDGSLVAIKRWNPSAWSSSSASFSGTRYLCLPGRGRKQKRKLVSETLPALSRLKHPNLVPVRGWCCTGSELIIVYDYMPNASLDKWLHPGEALLTLPWLHRWKLALDIAAALQHLHSCKFVHSRLKSSNVLLDITFQARVGDFGFTAPSARASTPGDSYHLPPEMFQEQHGEWTSKMDVFAFGVVCLELVTGGPPDSGLVDRAWLLHEESKSLEELVDSRLERKLNWDQAMLLCGLGLLCTHPDPNSRPSMELILGVLERKTEMSPIPSRTLDSERV